MVTSYSTYICIACGVTMPAGPQGETPRHSCNIQEAWVRSIATSVFKHGPHWVPVDARMREIADEQIEKALNGVPIQPAPVPHVSLDLMGLPRYGTSIAVCSEITTLREQLATANAQLDRIDKAWAGNDWPVAICDVMNDRARARKEGK